MQKVIKKKATKKTTKKQTTKKNSAKKQISAKPANQDTLKKKRAKRKAKKAAARPATEWAPKKSVKRPPQPIQLRSKPKEASSSQRRNAKARTHVCSESTPAVAARFAMT